jgi:glucose uptake protein GlcU
MSRGMSTAWTTVAIVRTHFADFPGQVVHGATILGLTTSVWQFRHCSSHSSARITVGLFDGLGRSFGALGSCRSIGFARNA